MLTRLSLNLTQVCNLGCGYCYAKGGDYGGPPKVMSEQTAIAKLDEAARAHRNIKLIQFFGGEPLINYKLMSSIVAHSRKLVQEGVLDSEPKYGIVTNLTLMRDHIAEFLKEIKCDIVVSLDGPEDIHDKLRPTKKGKGSHHIVVRNIEELSAMGISVDIEVTFTNSHISMGYSVVDMLKYAMQFNPNLIQIANAADSDPNIGFKTRESQDICISMHLDAIKYSISELKDGRILPYGLMKDMIKSIMSGREYNGEVMKRKNYCTASTSNLSISSDGVATACHMFTNNEKYIVDVSGVEPRVNIITRDDHGQCQVCWARHWCTACVGNFEILSPGDPKPTRTHCEVTRKGLAYVLSELSAPSLVTH